MSNNKKNKNITLVIILFILLISIGLIKDNIFGLVSGITLHQKVFKTFLIFIFDLILLSLLIIRTSRWKKGLDKQKKYLLFFILYFLFIFIQFVISYFSKEISYDREYYLANYTFLIIFSMLCFFYINDLKDLKIGLLVISTFFIIVLLWTTKEFFVARKASTSFRPELSFGNTNYFAGYAIGLLPLAILSSFVWYNKNKKFYQNWLSIIIFIIGLLGTIPIYFTKTRAALFGCYIGFSVILIPSLILMIDKLSFKIKIPIVVLCIIIFLFIPIILLKYPLPIINKLFGRLVITMESPTFFIKDRINGWTGSFGLFKDHPIFGAGLGTTYPASFKYIGKYFYLYSDSNSFKHAHNEFVEVLGEGGVFGIVFFFALFGFVLISLLTKIYSKKYSRDFRLISLGVCAGIISMLIHQIFSLTLRMSVTMTAYFFLLGIGIFLISYSGKALIVETENNKHGIIPEFLQNKINLKETYIIFAITLLFVIMALFLFLPLFKSEINIVKSIKYNSTSIKLTNIYLNRAIQFKPDNPYAWTEKYNFDNDILSYISYQGNYEESYFDEVKKDLDTLNSIIPGYQNVWSKYARLYLNRNIIYANKFHKSFNLRDLDESKKALEKAIEYLDKSLNMNFLYDYDHIYKLLILSELQNEREYKEAVKDFIKAKIFLDFAKPKKILKENINIGFNGQTILDIVDSPKKKKTKLYNFKISNEVITKISERSFGAYYLNDFDKLEQIFNEEIDSILKNLNLK